VEIMLKKSLLALLVGMLLSACQTLNVKLNTPTPELPQESSATGEGTSSIREDLPELQIPLSDDWEVFSIRNGDVESSLSGIKAVDEDLYNYLLDQCLIGDSQPCMLVAYDNNSALLNGLYPPTLNVHSTEHPADISPDVYIQTTIQALNELPFLLSPIEGIVQNGQGGDMYRLDYVVSARIPDGTDQPLQIYQYFVFTPKYEFVFTFSSPLVDDLSTQLELDSVMQSLLIYSPEGQLPWSRITI
jgi:hypothetical protein